MEHSTQLTPPDITHPQALILRRLGDSAKVSAVDLREDCIRSSASFYQLMTRMINCGLVIHFTENVLGRDFTFYSATAKGREALQEAINFYEQLAS